MKRFLLVLFVLFSLPVYAQNTNQAQVRLVVVDETGAGIPNATIIMTPAAGVAVTFSTDEHGVATSPSMLTGNVTLHVEFEGFQPYEAPLTLRRGAMNQTVTLKIAGVQEEVVVSDTTATDDRRGNSFSTTLEESEIEELPDDPDELADVLAAMAGGSGAVFQVNGFRGGRLPVARRDSSDSLPHELVLRRQPRRRPDADRDHHPAERPAVERQRQLQLPQRLDERAQRVLDERRRPNRTATSTSARAGRSSRGRRRFASASTAGATIRPTPSSRSTKSATVSGITSGVRPTRPMPPLVSSTR